MKAPEPEELCPGVWADREAIHQNLKSLFKPEMFMGILEGSSLSVTLLQLSSSFGILVAPGYDYTKMSVDSSWNS